eukprot:maker-scaffold515_size150689-snap-gene-0.34 protein:Tk06548 transcript:maker-scaffold515_size150689-snap-gene-0.34-mRNA-1 annotation:"rna-binding protein nova-1-like"
MDTRKRSMADSPHKGSKSLPSKTRKDNHSGAPTKDVGAPHFAPVDAGTPLPPQPCINVKFLIPSRAMGPIMGRKGEALNQWQQTNLKVKISKANSFFPGTQRRVCLMIGAVEKVTEALIAFNDKIWSRDGVQFDAAKELEMTLVVPNETAGLIIGSGGRFIKDLVNETGADIKLSRKEDDFIVSERKVVVTGRRDSILEALGRILKQVQEDPYSGSCLTVDYDPDGRFSRSKDKGASKPEEMASDPGHAIDRSDKSSPFTVHLSSGELMHLKMKMDGSHSHIDPNLTEQYLHALGNNIRQSGIYPPPSTDDILRSFSTLISHGIFQFEFTANRPPPAQPPFVVEEPSHMRKATYPPGPPPLGAPWPEIPPSATDGPQIQEEEKIEIEDGSIGSIMGRGGQILSEIQKSSRSNIVISPMGVFASGTRNRIIFVAGDSQDLLHIHTLHLSRSNHHSIDHSLGVADRIRPERGVVGSCLTYLPQDVLTTRSTRGPNWNEGQATNPVEAKFSPAGPASPSAAGDPAGGLHGGYKS